MIRIFNGMCGSGKTHAALELAETLVKNNKRVLYVSPSTELQYEISTRLGNIPNKIINHMENMGNREMGVAATIEKYITYPPAHAEILIITHAAFKTLPHFYNKKEWTVFIDEEMEILEYIFFDATEAANYAFGNNLVDDISKISTMKIHSAGYTSIHNKHHSREDSKYLKQISYGGKGSSYVYPPFQRFIQLLLNPNMKIYADTASMVAFKFGNVEAEMWAELDTSIFTGFENLYLMGAEIQRSKMCAYFKLKGISTTMATIPKRFEKHDQPINIRWMSPYKTWSKNYYTALNEKNNSVTNFQLFDALVASSIGDEKILLQNNKGNPFKHIKNPVQMSYEVKGLNQFDKYHHYCESGAYRMPPACSKKLADLGFDVEHLQLHHALQHAYQGAMRGSLRNGTFNNNVIYLPTLYMSQNMRNIYFPNAKLEQIAGAEHFFNQS